MMGYVEKRIVIILVGALILTVSTPILSVSQTIDQEQQKTGPFIDKLVYYVIESDAEQMRALQNNEIDIIGGDVDPTYASNWHESDDIEITETPYNAYGYITINTGKYPFNITAYRRALAFALDKEKISEEVWDGLAQPLDSIVPEMNPFSAENVLEDHYYRADVDKGKQLLAAAGFLDSDSDGHLEGPGPNGAGTVELDKVSIECAQISNMTIDVSTIVAKALSDLGFEAEAQPTDFYEYLNRLNFHQDYDIAFYTIQFDNFDVDWLAYEYWSEYANEPYWNFPNFRNSDYDAWRDQLLHSTDYDKVYQAAIEMQKIIFYQSPIIVCYNSLFLSAYRTDRFEGFVNDVSEGVSSWWTNLKIHLKDNPNSPVGGTFRWSIPLDIDTFNFMTHSFRYTVDILSHLYDRLLVQDPQGRDLKWLAESYAIETHADNSSVPEGHTHVTFQLIKNATWIDERPLTAEDVAYALNYYKLAPGNPYGQDLTDLVDAHATSQYSLVVKFNTESYWHLHKIGYKPIIPKHIFEQIGYDNWNTWLPFPPDHTMVTSGPFNISKYVRGEFIELTYNPNYFYRPYRSLTNTSGTTNSTGGSTVSETTAWWNDPSKMMFLSVALAIDGIVAIVIVIDYLFILRKRK
ncbi:MAG: ABC transporter substrate-binding protein [Candidatus Thorarchaeota archaeon]